MRETDPDAGVLEQVGRGDVTGALHQLMRRHGRTLYRYCREALRDATRADDIHQQVFIEAYRDLPCFRGRSTVRAWLFAIARHRVLDSVRQHRRAQLHIEEVEIADLPDPGASPVESIDDARLREALIASIRELDERARTALLLRYQQGFTFEEMAEICRETPGTLHARVTRALPLLRARIQSRIGRMACNVDERR